MVDEVRLLGYLKPSSFRALKMERANMKLNLWMIANRLYQMEPKLYIPESDMYLFRVLYLYINHF